MSLWQPVTGIGQYTANIARCWKQAGWPRAEYFYGADWEFEARARQSRGRNALKDFARRFVPRAYEIARAGMQRTFDRRTGRFDVYFEPSFLPLRFDGPLVLTVHDLSHVRFAQTHPPARVRILSKLLPAAVERAAHILTDSQFQRGEILSYFGLAADRVTACPLGVSGEFRPRPPADCAQFLLRHGLSHGGYLLAVGTLEPRKNLLAALESFAALPPALRARWPLVVAGSPGWNDAVFAPRLRALVRSDAVRMLGYVDAAELPLLYAAARVFLFPSLYEGFGLPVLEAMASGVPVIVSDASSLPEVVGDAGTRIDPLDPLALARAIVELLEDESLHAARREAGIARARGFTWEACASTTADVLARAAGHDRPPGA